MLVVVFTWQETQLRDACGVCVKLACASHLTVTCDGSTRGSPSCVAACEKSIWWHSLQVLRHSNCSALRLWILTNSSALRGAASPSVAGIKRRAVPVLR